MPVVRPFSRSDRDQVTALVNAHAAAVVPGAVVSVNRLLSQLEREPGDFMVDPWVAERLTLVAEQRSEVVAAAHLVRYLDGEQVATGYRGAGEVRWLVARPPGDPNRLDVTGATDALAAACVDQLRRWQVSRSYADGALPVPGVYGVPDAWPHVADALARAGFRHTGDGEVVLMARVEDVRDVLLAPMTGLRRAVSVGLAGVRISALAGGTRLGYIEVDTCLGDPLAAGGLADVGNLWIDAESTPAGHSDHVAHWLLAQAGAWLHLAGASRLLAYTGEEEDREVDLYESVGFAVVAHTRRGFELTT